MILALAHISLSNSLGWKNEYTRDHKALTLMCLPLMFLIWIIFAKFGAYIGISIFEIDKVYSFLLGVISWVCSSIIVGVNVRNKEKTNQALKTYKHLSSFQRFCLNGAVVLIIFGSIPMFLMGLFWGSF